MLFVLVSVAQAGELSRISNGWWLSAPTAGVEGTVMQDVNLWVDISAQNVGYGKHVGIRWTDDGWVTWHDAEAWYEGSLGNNQEQWGVDIKPMGTWTADGLRWKYRQWDGDWLYADSTTIEYAIWMTYGAASWWDNNGDHNYSLTLRHE